MRALKFLMRAASEHIGFDDVAFLIGGALLSIGAGQIYAPAGLIVPGVLLVFVAVK